MAREYINPPDVHPPASYHHAVKTGNTVWLAGQVGIKPDGTLAGTDVVSQAKQAFENIRRVLAAAGASMNDIVQLRVYLTHYSYLPGYIEARKDIFDKVPASTLLFVQSLARPEILVEI